MYTKEYRRLVREVAKENNIRIGKSWTDYLGGMCVNRHLPTRVVTMEIFGEMDNMENFWEELKVYCALRSGGRPRLTATGYLKFNADITPQYGVWSEAALEGLTS